MTPASSALTIGVLAIQGSFAEHLKMLEKIGVKSLAVKTKKDLEQVDGLIMPGGESTTISKLLKITGLKELIKKKAKKGMPIYGTCAGSILLAKKVSGKTIPESLNLMDVDIERNAYGSQLDSFEGEVILKLKNKTKKIVGIFIRAPLINKTAKNVQVLGTTKNKQIVCAQQNNILISTFHPELTAETTIHEYFIKLCQT